jgi:uncharacterized membrane protein
MIDTQLLIGLALVLLPIAGLRVGIPIIVEYSLRNQISFIPFFLLAVLIGMLFAITFYFFLEFLHQHFMKWKFYARLFNKFVEKIRKKHEKFEKRYNDLGYLGLFIYVSIPIPGSGIWAGTFLAWFLGLEKKKALPTICAGVFIYGLIVLLMTLGFFGLFYR